MLPLMQIYEIADIMFFINFISNITPKFNILSYDFSTGTTRSTSCKLYHKTASANSVMNSYFYRLPKLCRPIPAASTHNQIQIEEILSEPLFKYFDSAIPRTFHYLCPCTHCTKSPSPCNHSYLQYFSLIFYIVHY